jgi:hypothetical protein
MFLAGIMIGVSTTYFYSKKYPTKISHSCDAAVKGCEIVAISIEHQLQRCEYVANKVMDILSSCKEISPECTKIFRESVE